MVQFYTLAAQSASAAPAVSQSSQTRSASANPTSTPYAIPITGPSSDNSTKWGVNTTSEGSPIGRDNPVVPLTVVIGNSDESSTFPVRREIVDGAEPPFSLYVNDDGSEKLYSGSKSFLSAASKDSELIDVPTVPFGVNLGNANAWNGSVTLNGYYDANRVNSTSWIELSSDGEDEKQFSKKGTLKFSGLVQDKNTSSILDFSHHAIVLPEGYSCSNISIQPEGASYAIEIPDSLLNDDTCYTRDMGGVQEYINLGWPFFQAAYVYAGKAGTVYLAQANDYNLPSKTAKFSADEELKPPAAPGGGDNNSPSPSSSPTGTSPSGPSATSSSPPEPTSSESAGTAGRVVDRASLALGFFFPSLMAILTCRH